MSDKNVFSYFKRVYTDKAEYREQMAGLKKLPREYQVVYKEIQNFLRNKLHIMLSTDLQKRFMQLNLNTTELECMNCWPSLKKVPAIMFQYWN